MARLPIDLRIGLVANEVTATRPGRWDTAELPIGNRYAATRNP